MNFQKTIKEPIEFKGVGLHNGVKVNLSLKPAEVNTGIKFERTRIEKPKTIVIEVFNIATPTVLWHFSRVLL